MIQFFHTADIHFGVENYGTIDPATGIHTRLLDFKKSLDLCIDQAIERKVDFFLFSGDAYKTAHPTPTQQKLLLQCLLRLQQANIPVVIIVGNHDHPLSFGKAHALDVFADLPLAGLHVFSKPEKLLLTTQHGPVQIVGIPWPTRHTLVAREQHRYKTAKEVTTYLAERIGDIIQSFAQELDPAIPAVLAGHLTVSSGVFSGSEKTAVFGTDPVLLPSQLAIYPFDYVALGHLHRHQNLNPHGHPPVVYAGSIDRVDFGERKETKGFCSVTLDTDKPWGERCTYSFIELATRPFIQIDVHIPSAATNQTTFITDAIGKFDINEAIVKIVYHLPHGTQDKVDLAQVSRACARARYVAGIIPVHAPVARERRAVVNVNMDIDTLLNQYFAAKGLDDATRARLLEKAHTIHDAVQAEQEQQE
jgi:exonuclease SbcD